jgi:hypothetical protein
MMLPIRARGVTVRHFHLYAPLRRASLLKCRPYGVYPNLPHITRLLSSRVSHLAWLPCDGGLLKLNGWRILWCNMERPKAKSGKSDDPPLVPDEGFRSAYPLLTEMLESVRYSDGSIRKTSTLTFFAECCVWKACLNDREQEQTLYRSGPSIADAMEALERALGAGGEDDWRSWKKSSARRK